MGVQLKTVVRISHHCGFAGISQTTTPGLSPVTSCSAICKSPFSSTFSSTTRPFRAYHLFSIPVRRAGPTEHIGWRDGLNCARVCWRERSIRFYCPPAPAVIVSTFARRDNCDGQRCCGCRAAKKRNRGREGPARHQRVFVSVWSCSVECKRGRISRQLTAMTSHDEKSLKVRT